MAGEARSQPEQCGERYWSTCLRAGRGRVPLGCRVIESAHVCRGQVRHGAESGRNWEESSGSGVAALAEFFVGAHVGNAPLRRRLWRAAGGGVVVAAGAVWGTFLKVREWNSASWSTSLRLWTSLRSCSDKFQQFLFFDVKVPLIQSSTECGPSCCAAETCTHGANYAENRRDPTSSVRGRRCCEHAATSCSSQRGANCAEYRRDSADARVDVLVKCSDEFQQFTATVGRAPDQLWRFWRSVKGFSPHVQHFSDSSTRS